jgi:hypothetical protein
LRTAGWTVTATALLASLADGQTDPLVNQYCSAELRPPQYATFQPPPAGESFLDPVFGAEVHVLTDQHNIVEFNGERAHFSQDDNYFYVGVTPDRNRKNEVWLYDGRSGAQIKKIPIEPYDRVRWAYDPKTLVYFVGKQIRGYHVETDADTLIHEFDEPVELCGGDGNDFDDKGEWILLNYGAHCTRMFAFNIRTGETGREFDCPERKADIDYATITPSGQYVVVLCRLRGSSPYSGIGLYDRDGVFLRQLAPFHGHAEFGYLNGTEECVFLEVGKDCSDWRQRWGLNPWDMLAVSLATGEVTKLLDQVGAYGQFAAIGGVNRRYVYAALESHNRQPDGKWNKHTGEIVEVPLDGSLRVRRLLHHRCRPSVNKSHTFLDQPEVWVNHAGDRLFFRSNMFLAPGSAGQKYGHDLFMIKIPPRETVDPPSP